MNAAAATVLGLPPVRRDLAAARADLDRTGIAILSGAFDPADVDEARAAIDVLAASERAEGCAHVGPGVTQRVWGLVHKAAVSRRMVTHPAVLELTHHILGPRMVLYSMQAHLVPPGGEMDPHFDQTFAPLPPFPILAAAVVMLDDFTPENGATRIAVGCEAREADEAPPALERMVPLTAPRGALAAYGGLLWHSTGINRTSALRRGILIHFCLPWVRQHENYQRTISASALERYTPEMRALLGIHEDEYGRRWRERPAG